MHAQIVVSTAIVTVICVPLFTPRTRLYILTWYICISYYSIPYTRLYCNMICRYNNVC
jgi:hypothetical protein